MSLKMTEISIALLRNAQDLLDFDSIDKLTPFQTLF